MLKNKIVAPSFNQKNLVNPENQELLKWKNKVESLQNTLVKAQVQNKQCRKKYLQRITQLETQISKVQASSIYSRRDPRSQEIQNQKITITELTNYVQKLKIEIQQKNIQLLNKKSLQKEIDQLKITINKIKKDSSQQCQIITNNFQRQIKKNQQLHQKQIKKIETSKIRQNTQIIKKIKQQMIQSHNYAIQQVQQKYQLDIQKLKNTIDQIRGQAVIINNKKCQQIRTQYKLQMDQVKALHLKAIQSIRQKNQKQKDQLNVQIKKYRESQIKIEKQCEQLRKKLNESQTITKQLSAKKQDLQTKLKQFSQKMSGYEQEKKNNEGKIQQLQKQNIKQKNITLDHVKIIEAKDLQIQRLINENNKLKSMERTLQEKIQSRAQSKAQDQLIQSKKYYTNMFNMLEQKNKRDLQQFHALQQSNSMLRNQIISNLKSKQRQKQLYKQINQLKVTLKKTQIMSEYSIKSPKSNRSFYEPLESPRIIESPYQTNNIFYSPRSKQNVSQTYSNLLSKKINQPHLTVKSIRNKLSTTSPNILLKEQIKEMEESI